MKWRGRQQSQNVNDQRGRSGMSGRGVAVGGGGLGLIIAIVYFLITGNPGALTNLNPVQPPASPSSRPTRPRASWKSSSLSTRASR